MHPWPAIAQDVEIIEGFSDKSAEVGDLCLGLAKFESQHGLGIAAQMAASGDHRFGLDVLSWRDANRRKARITRDEPRMVPDEDAEPHLRKLAAIDDGASHDGVDRGSHGDEEVGLSGARGAIGVLVGETQRSHGNFDGFFEQIAQPDLGQRVHLHDGRGDIIAQAPPGLLSYCGEVLHFESHDGIAERIDDVDEPVASVDGDSEGEKAMTRRRAAAIQRAR